MNWKSLRNVLAGALGMLVLIAVATIILLPLYGNYAERARVVDLLAALRGVRDAVESEALRTGTLQGVGINITKDSYSELKNLADVVSVLDNGIILARTIKYGSFVVLQPTLNGDSISWKCIGGPRKDMPTQCRDP